MSVVPNPALPGCYPDPTVCRVGDEFYLVTSTFEYFPGLPVFRSRDLVSWEQIGHVVDRAGQLDFDGIPSSGGLYAPTLRHHDGVFWLVCTLVDPEDPARGGNFLMTAADPAGPWSDPVWLDVDGIDPSIVFDGDRVWMHGTRLAPDPEWPQQTQVWLREYDPGAAALVGTEHILWTGAVRGAVWAEGPHLYVLDDRYYLVAAEGGTAFEHAVSVARADRITGPYTGYKGNPVLTHRHLGRGSEIVGVGHADLVEAPDGSWWAVVLGMRTYGGYHHNLGRETFLVPVEWQEGWPVFAPGEGRVPAEVDVPFAADPTPGVVQGTVSGPVQPDDPRWTALRGPASAFATPAGMGWRIDMSPLTLAQPRTPAFLGVRQQHRDVEVSARLRVDPQPGEEAGLVVRQSEADHVRLAVARNADGTGSVVAVHRRSGIETVLAERPWEGPEAELAVRVHDQDYALVLGGADEDGGVVLAVADGRTLDSVATGGFLGLWFGVYATSNGRPTTTSVDVERFDYVPV